MSGGGSSPSIPKAPKYGKSYQKGINVYLRNLPRMLQAEQDARTQYDPQRIQEQQDLQSQYGPRQYQQMLDAQNTLDPTLNKNRTDLGNTVNSELNAGMSLTGDEQRQMEQYVRSSQAARGNVFGGAAQDAEAYATGDRARQIQQQRIQNVGNFINGPTAAQQMMAIPPVAADRSSAYVDPNAGFQGAQAAQQTYANQVGAASAGAASSGGSGGWGSALSTIGSVIGLVGMFSDRRMKKNITKVGTGPKGIGIYDFNYKERRGAQIPPFANSERHSEPRYRGVIAQDVQDKIPGAVSTDPESGMKAVDYQKIGFPMRRVS